uniref:5'-3' exonuclease H3TH domain-containing protein n=1 Tax=Acetatifactor sp. TaxID=1872090 RepID=UPI0040565192
MNKKLVLIDGHSILNRAFYGVPDLSNAEGLHTNAIYGFLNILFKILEEEQPDYLAVAFDVHAPTFRHQMYEAYKGTRKAMPDELREQVPVMKEVLRAMNVVIMEQAGLEADDILGTLAKKAEMEGIAVSLVSGDRDLLQIATDHIKIRIPKTKMGRTEIEDYYASDVLATYQVTPTQFIELKALMGDTADNIPGVPKVGEKTATSLMVEYGSIENIYAHVEEISKKSIKESLIQNKELADLSKVLATIKTDCEIELDYEAAKAEGYYTKDAYAIFKRLEFKNMLGRFEAEASAEDNKVSESFRTLNSLEEFFDFVKKAERAERVGVLLMQEKEQVLGVALSVSEEETQFYALSHAKEEEGQLSLFAEPVEIADDTEQVREALIALSENTNIATFDIKRQYDYLAKETTERYFDVLIGAYLLNPLKNDYDLEAIASEHLQMMIPGAKETFGKEKPAEVLEKTPEKCAQFYCYGAYVARKASDVITEKLKAANMYNLMCDVEMPLSLVLYDMEQEGVMVRREELKEYGDALISRIDELEESIHKQAGVEFNINSP